MEHPHAMKILSREKVSKFTAIQLIIPFLNIHLNLGNMFVNLFLMIRIDIGSITYNKNNFKKSD